MQVLNMALVIVIFVCYLSYYWVKGYNSYRLLAIIVVDNISKLMIKVVFTLLVTSFGQKIQIKSHTTQTGVLWITGVNAVTGREMFTMCFGEHSSRVEGDDETSVLDTQSELTHESFLFSRSHTQGPDQLMSVR